MRKEIVLSVLVFCLLLMSILVQFKTDANANPENVEGWAVILEMNSFPEGWSSFPSMNFKNSEMILDALMESGWETDHLYVKHDNLTRSVVEEAVEWLINNSDVDDVALLYIFTHGSWMRWELEWNSWFPTSWEQINTSKKMLMVDSCAAGEFIEVIRESPEPHISLAHCSAGEVGWAGIPEEGLPIIGSVWNYYFTNALCNFTADSDANGFVSVEEAFNFSTPLMQRYMNETVYAVPEFLELYHDIGVYPENYDAYPHPVIDDQYPEQLYLNLDYYKMIIVPDDYLTIQGAINAANEGDIVFVRSGTYYENVVVNKTVSLIGENRSTTIIDGNGTGYVVEIYQAQNATLSNFTVNNGEQGICITHSSNCIIINNKIVSQGFGIYGGAFTNNSFLNNIILDVEFEGIKLFSVENTYIIGNSITNVTAWWALSVQDSTHCAISNNNISETSGVRLMWCSYMEILRNSICYSGGAPAVSLFRSNNTIVEENVCANNNRGILVTGINNQIRQNTFMKNDYGIEIGRADNTIYHNNFIDNQLQVRFVSGIPVDNIWDNGYPSGGNYWSDYNGTDLFYGPDLNYTGKDGIGDTPYIIDENNVDHFPLMTSFPPIPGDANCDEKVRIDDILAVVLAFGSDYGDPRYEPILDINGDSKIRIDDILIVAQHFGEGPW